MSVSKKKQQRPRQKRGLQTYEKLVVCGIRLLAESDLSGLRFSQLSKVSKVPQSLIDYHFPSIESLQMAMIQYKMNQLLRLTIDTLEKNKNNARKALEAYIKVPFQFAQQDAEFAAIWTAYYHLITVNKNIAGFNTTVQKSGHERIMNLVRSLLVQEGLKLTSEISLDDLAHAIHGIIIGYAMMASTRSDANFSHWQKIAVQSITLLLQKSTK